MTLSVSVDATDAAGVVVPDVLDVSALWAPSFPSADLVGAAAGMFTRLRPWDGSEGPRARIVIGPGCVSVGRVDPAKAERAEAKRRHASRVNADLLTADCLLEHRLEDADAGVDAVVALRAGGLATWGDVERAAEDADYLARRIERRDAEPAPAAAKITAWSSKSRANMVRTLAQLDYAPLFTGAGLPAMQTFTYPGEWLEVAPSPAACKAHLDTFKKRFLRAYGRPLVGVWKREFQRRGAPHYHVLMVPPWERVNGLDYSRWSARTWAEIVGAESCGHAEPAPDFGCCERHRHLYKGTSLDYAEGTRARDPKRLAVYFSKHGAYAAKEYQNHAPVEWSESGSVGRFWGVWGLERATATVEVTEVEALAAARTLRRWQRANGYRITREVRRRRWNTATGEMRHASRCGRGECEGYCYSRKSGAWSGARMRGSAGFVVVNDGAAIAATLSRHLDAVRLEAQESELAAWAASPARLHAIDRPVSRQSSTPETGESSVSDLLCVWPPVWRTGGAESPVPVRRTGWAGAVSLF